MENDVVVLRDGTRVRIRPVRPDDKERIARGFERLSPESRYRRFLAPKGALSASELRYLTEFDGVDHFALGAVALEPAEEGPGEREGEGLAIARFVRCADDPEAAEAAVVVADDAQRKGLGRALLERLIAAARERGIRRFRCDLLANNAPVRHLLAALGPAIRAEVQGDVLSVEIALPELAHPPGPAAGGAPAASAIDQILVLAARGAIVVRHALEEVLLRRRKPPS